MRVSLIDSTEELEVSHNTKIKKHVLISKDVIDHLTMFSRAVFPPGEIADSHSHSEMTEVFFVVSGQGLILVNDRSVPLQTGTCVTVEPEEMHELKNTGSTDMVVLYFGIKK